MNHEVQITGKNRLNHDVARFRLERPGDYQFTAGRLQELNLEADSDCSGERDKIDAISFHFRKIMTA
ncbi:MAG TPA: hypothetical protein PLV32_08000 [Chitinophagaceae bacterium]|nr:hypothetical protein [Chitinophagaceae bacterium]